MIHGSCTIDSLHHLGLCYEHNCNLGIWAYIASVLISIRKHPSLKASENSVSTTIDSLTVNLNCRMNSQYNISLNWCVVSRSMPRYHVCGRKWLQKKFLARRDRGLNTTLAFGFGRTVRPLEGSQRRVTPLCLNNIICSFATCCYAPEKWRFICC